ncbi:MAG: pyruvate flavodoxin/ferredoxin oxidoreductase [Pseudomonadota bacterium]
MLEFTTGAQVICRAAIAAGCKFFAGYPITPATGILLGMHENLPQYGGLVIQGEDELASIGFCLGASATGLKVMTATSGPGMSLYSENIGFAQMAELPIVIVNVQRMGPATGGATTNAEGDIQFSKWIAPGGYPLITLAPTNLAECYELTIKAFNLAERFRCPVILSTSKDLVATRDTVDTKKYFKPKIINRPKANVKNFQPYAYQKTSDVPPFAPLGGDLLTRFNTSTHDQNGILTWNTKKADLALNHLNDKIMKHSSEIETVEADIEKGAKQIIVAYGMMARVSKHVVRHLRSLNKKISLLTVHSLWPLPEKSLKKYVGKHSKIIVPELNLGQYCLEIERLFPNQDLVKINRIDGKLISPEEIIKKGKLL